MNHSEQISQFANELEALIDRFRAEYDLPYASVIGVLQMASWDLNNELMADDE